MLNRRPRFRHESVPQAQPYVFDSDNNVRPFTPVVLSMEYKDFSVQNCQKLGLNLRPMSSQISRPFDVVNENLQQITKVLESQLKVNEE